RIRRLRPDRRGERTMKVWKAAGIASLGLWAITGLAEEDPPAGWERAERALQLLGADVPGATGSCGECHGLSRAKLRAWAQETQQKSWGCELYHLQNGNDGGDDGSSDGGAADDGSTDPVDPVDPSDPDPLDPVPGPGPGPLPDPDPIDP